MALSILITGCSSGIGQYCAKQLALAGHQVFATVRREQEHAALLACGIQPIHMDLADLSSIQQGFADMMRYSGGKIDILFNNAAYGQPGAVEDLPTAVLIEQFQVNVFAWHELSQLALKTMRQQNSGRIIQNSSVLGVVAMKYRGAYNASKFALEGLTDTMRLELGDTNIHISLIEPGPIVSRFREHALAAFRANINIEASPHKKAYQQTLARLAATESNNKFTLGPEAVYQALLEAIHAKRPKARYRVTTPTKVFAMLKRLLPTSLLDKLLKQVA
ncbi:SDR family oxidoreductase [Motilimonas pumila]|uniref:SDR family oxidoreductase n=1 Tax=Motilimonas pumila TaxID=2303987 RepID=A0A418YB90_9GAMM|nr:SDR family oxidoreductase [Motilimonas pumila]RJG40265.1 SDR family oxidoreductase [Motilimonas pumila]